MLETIIKQITEGKSIWVIIGSLLITLIVNLTNINYFLDSLFKRKLTVLKKIVGEKGATESTREVVQEEINSILFQYATGIKVDKHLREEIITIYKVANGRITYENFKKARSFLRIRQDGTLEVREFTLFDRVENYLSYVISWLFWFTSVMLVVIFIFFPISGGLRIQLGIFLYALLFFGLAILTFSQTFPLSNALKIKDEIRKIREQSFYPYAHKELKPNQSSKVILPEAEKQAARKRFESHFGEINLSFPIGTDNEMIDADITREYTSNHQED